MVCLFDFLLIGEEIDIFWLVNPVSTYFSSDSCKRNLHALHHEVLFEGRIFFKLVFTAFFWCEPVTCIIHRGSCRCCSIRSATCRYWSCLCSWLKTRERHGRRWSCRWYGEQFRWRHTSRSRNFRTCRRWRWYKPVRRGLSSVDNNGFFFRRGWRLSFVSLKQRIFCPLNHLLLSWFYPHLLLHFW